MEGCQQFTGNGQLTLRIMDPEERRDMQNGIDRSSYYPIDRSSYESSKKK